MFSRAECETDGFLNSVVYNVPKYHWFHTGMTIPEFQGFILGDKEKREINSLCSIYNLQLFEL